MTSLTNRTPSKRNPYASESERTKRLNANLIERKRMQNINTGFSTLKKLLPPSDRKQTKAAILHQASQHIVRLQRAILQVKTENETLRRGLEASNFSQRFPNHRPGSDHRLYLYDSPNPCIDYTPVSEPKPTGCDQSRVPKGNAFGHALVPKPLTLGQVVRHKKRKWDPYDCVMKAECVTPEMNVFQNGLELQSFDHVCEPGPLTPPFTPPEKPPQKLEISKNQSHSDSVGRSTSSDSPPSYTKSLSLFSTPRGSSLQKNNCPGRKAPMATKSASFDETRVGFEQLAHVSTERKESDVGLLKAKVKTPELKKSQGYLNCILEAIKIVEKKKNGD